MEQIMRGRWPEWTAPAGQLDYFAIIALELAGICTRVLYLVYQPPAPLYYDWFAVKTTCSTSDFRLKLQAVVPTGECAQHCALKVVNHQNTLRLSIPDVCQVPVTDAPYDLIYYAPTHRTAALNQQGLSEHDLCMCQMSLRMQRQRRFSLEPTARGCFLKIVGERLAIGDWGLLDAQYVPPSKHVNISMQPSYEPETCRSWEPLEVFEGPTFIVKYNRANESACSA